MTRTGCPYTCIDFLREREVIDLICELNNKIWTEKGRLQYKCTLEGSVYIQRCPLLAEMIYCTKIIYCKYGYRVKKNVFQLKVDGSSPFHISEFLRSRENWHNSPFHKDLFHRSVIIRQIYSNIQNIALFWYSTR